MERGGTAEKIAYMEDMTEIILKEKANARENPWGIALKMVKGGFVERWEDTEHLYGVTYGVYVRADGEKWWPKPLW